MRERILLVGSPGSGKTYQVVKVYDYLKSLGIKMHLIDLEDKLEAFLFSAGYNLGEIDLHIALSYEELKDVIKNKLKVKPDEWIGVDRFDLSWDFTQRYYSEVRYEQDLADRMVKKAKEMRVESSRFVPRFDEGAWSVVNENYASVALGLMYKFKANVIMTAGIKRAGEAPIDVLANLGVVPRGQKELGHQPNGVFLLSQQREGREISWNITTGKDLPNRNWFDREELYDFALQYLSDYVK